MDGGTSGRRVGRLQDNNLKKLTVKSNDRGRRQDKVNNINTLGTETVIVRNTKKKLK